MRTTRHALISAGLLALAAGCGDSRPVAPLTSNAFIAPSPAAAPAPEPGSRPAVLPTTPPTAPPQVTSPEVQRAATRPSIALAPASLDDIPVVLAPGQYQTIGGVVSEVNGNPIYAGKVLRALRPELAARAPEMDEGQFRRFATEEIMKKVRGLQRDELLFAAADRFLTADDRRMAEMLTMQYRARLITDAGGSIELARRKAAADGEDFEEQILDQYRRFMTDVYYRRKVFPRIQITADDMRSYYNQNVGREFTELGEVRFRLIRIDPRVRGGAERAREVAEQVRARALEGDFAEVARSINDDARLARAGGEEAPVQRGAYRLEKVEAAAWELAPGAVSEVIEDTGGFYIAKVEQQTRGRVAPFDDRKVQEDIRERLWQRQFRDMAEEIEQSLRRTSMVRESPEMLQTVMEMAMQGYAMWSKRP